MLGNLKGLAQDLGDELDRQNEQIGRLDKKAQVHDIHLTQANQRIRRQLWLAHYFFMLVIVVDRCLYSCILVYICHVHIVLHSFLRVNKLFTTDAAHYSIATFS